ncbi:MAG: hypothetical protein ACRD8W_30020, partial [Nitrososphaeraceae archaeon]
MKSFAIVLLIFVAVVTIAVFLYSFSYNLVLGQSNVSDVPYEFDPGNLYIYGYDLNSSLITDNKTENFDNNT